MEVSGLIAFWNVSSCRRLDNVNPKSCLSSELEIADFERSLTFSAMKRPFVPERRRSSRESQLFEKFKQTL